MESEFNGREALQALLDGKAIRQEGSVPGRFYVLADDGYICDETGKYGEDIDFWGLRFEILKEKVVEYMIGDSHAYRLE